MPKNESPKASYSRKETAPAVHHQFGRNPGNVKLSPSPGRPDAHREESKKDVLAPVKRSVPIKRESGKSICALNKIKRPLMKRKTTRRRDHEDTPAVAKKPELVLLVNSLDRLKHSKRSARRRECRCFPQEEATGVLLSTRGCRLRLSASVRAGKGFVNPTLEEPTITNHGKAYSVKQTHLRYCAGV